jgi:delta1-piperideine-2-carboxylate reductase
VDAAGFPTGNPQAILSGGGLLPFGGNKGSAVAFMVEILSAALSGGRFGFEDHASQFPGAKTSHAGEFILDVDPRRTAGEEFFERVEQFLARLKRGGVLRLPAERRYQRRRDAELNGVCVPKERFEALMRLAGSVE